jgi:hypothetical protein
MNTIDLVRTWFNTWEEGSFRDLPLSDDFQHVSPYGIISGKEAYLNLIEENLDMFLGHRFVIHDVLYDEEKACIRYTALKENFVLEVTEWQYFKDNRITKVIAYYNVEGEISDDRKLEYPGDD